MAQGNQPLKKNLAAEAFRRHYAALHDAIAQPDVASGLAAKLYSGAIIAVETRDAVLMPSFTPTQKADSLLQAVDSSIKIDHTRLRKFTRVLKKQPVLEPIAKQLRQCYRELVSEARLTENSSSGSDTDSTEHHQSQGRGIPKDSGAGNESSSATVTLPRILELKQKAEEGEETCKRTKRRIEGLEGKYMALVEKTQEEVMKQKPDLEIFRMKITLLPNYMLEEHQQYLKDHLLQLYNAESIPEIFVILNLCWNYLHYSLLQRIIEIYGTDDTKGVMECYIKDVKSFQQETTLAMFWEAHPKQTRPKLLGGEIVETLSSHAELTSSSSLKSVDELRQVFGHGFSLPDFAIALKEMLPGSVYMQEMSELLSAVDEVMKKKGELEQTILQGVFIGPPRNGKSSLMKRLLNRELPSSSTDVVENITRVTFKKPTMSTANISSDAAAFTWSELPFDNEVITLLKALSKNTDFSKSETVTEELPTSKPQCDVVHTLDTASEELDMGKIRADIEHSSSHSLSPAPAITFPQEIPEAKFKTHQEVLKESLENGWSEAKKYLEDACIMYLTDTGGQLEFQELLPALVSGPCVFFLVFRLDWDLNTEFAIHYSHSEKGQSKPYQSSIKLKDALLQSLASIAAMGTFVYEGQQMERLQPKVFFVGTHKDKVSEERTAEIDMELQKAIESTSFFRSGLVQPASDDCTILTVNNLSDDDDDSGIKQVRKAVERIINQDDFKVRAPPQWLIFSLVLRQSIDQPVISYEQCSSLASNCGINDSEELDKALWFLSTRVGLIRYYRNASEDLKNLIILDPSIIFRKISKLVIETFTFENLLVRNQSVRKDFVDKGLFWLNDFVKITQKCDELLTPSRLIYLLQHLHIIARIKQDGENAKLFMPCILKSTQSTGYPDSEASRRSKVPPLLVCFECGYCPKGIFPALVAYLLNHNNEKESEYPWILQESEIYKNQVSFSVGPCTVSLKVTPTYIMALCISSDPELSHIYTTCYNVHKSLKQGIHRVISDLHYAMDTKWCFAFVCQCCTLHECHGAELKGKVEEHNCYLLCHITKKSSKPPNGYDVWFTKGETMQETAKMPRRTTVVKLVDLIEHVTTSRWFDLGLFLGVDESTLQCIEQDTRGDCHTGLRRMFQEWLRSCEHPSWDNVIRALRKIRENKLAAEISQKLF